MLSRETKILLHSSNLWSFGEGLLGPLFAVFAQRIGGNVLDISWAWATYLIVTGLFIIFVGKISDKTIGKKKLLVFGYSLNAVLTFAYLLVQSPLHLFLLQAGLGFATALTYAPWNALYAKAHGKEHGSLAWGLVGGQGQIITGIALIVGGLIVNYFSFTALFIIMGIVQVLATIVQAQILNA